jgi:hypothetical protein
MCCDDGQALSFETLISDPLTRLVMASDRVTPAEMVEVLEVARAAVAARDPLPLAVMEPAGHA